MLVANWCLHWKVFQCRKDSHVHVCQQCIVSGGVRVRVWIREQKKIKRRSKITPPQTLQYSSHCCTSCASACLHAHVYQQHVTNTIACSSNFQETALPLLLRWFHLPYKANHLITFCPWDNSLISLYFSEANKTWYRPNTSCAVGALQFFRVVWLVDYPYIPHTRKFSRGS